MARSAIVWVLALLVLVGALARAEEKAGPVAEYKTFLASLPKDDPASITKAIDQYRTAIVPLDMDKHVNAFLEFFDFHEDVCNGVDKALWEELTHNGVIGVPDDDSEVVKQLRRHGLEIRGNGPDGFYVGGVPAYIPEMFSPFLPRSIQRYLELRLAEMREGYQVDAGLKISYARLAQRVANWERYLRNYPGSPVHTEALVLRGQYLLDLLFGMNNSPLDPATEDRSNNIRVVYEDYLRAHPGSYSARLVSAQYKHLKKTGYLNKTLDDDIRSIPWKRYDEVKAHLDRTVHLDRYRVDISSSYWAVKIEQK
jgi:hypothetical protein